MPPRRARVGSRKTTEPTIDLEVHLVNQDVRREQEETVYDRVAQWVIDVMTQQLEKKFGIERLEALGTTEFTGTTEPREADKRIKTLEKCFRVTQCSQERKVDLAMFLLQEYKEDW
ncbi:A-kinase anchor protein 12 [Cucumis melo var. makuwa]|uniref:A-kinase anchor protein 12 n=1 Tax=Cucumis melo var. makuwa TaxID=1194695 RepID=A0A5D3CSN0_CUCMM|nr:A-kinase anchor protein 12 [Cucumis melo var. makuwa]TYK14208.1 A-kinase anchor protein 12 [Cucumis melo var. makuwa]